MKSFSQIKAEVKKKVGYENFAVIRKQAIRELNQAIDKKKLGLVAKTKLYEQVDEATRMKKGGRFINEGTYDLLVDLINIKQSKKSAIKDMIQQRINDNIELNKTVKKFKKAIKKVKFSVVHHWTIEAMIVTYDNTGGKKSTQYHEETFEQYIERKDNDKEASLNEARDRIEKLLLSNAKVAYWINENVKILSRKDWLSTYHKLVERPVSAIRPYTYKWNLCDDLNIPEQDGECLPNGLFNMYKKYIPSLTLEKVKSFLIKKNGVYCFESAYPFFANYNIGYYVLDIMNKVKDKYVVPDNKRNYPPFICYIADIHVYIVTNKKARSHIIKTNQAGNLFVTSLEDKKHKLLEDKVSYDVPVDQLKKCMTDIVYYNKANLKHLLVSLYKADGVNYINKMVDNNVVSILYEAYKKKIQLKNNPNAIHKIGTKSVDHKDIQGFCNLFNLQFKNQSITELANELWNMFREKGEVQRRINISIKIKKQILEEQENKCALCHCVLQNCEFDHIKRLTDGGDNGRDNLQALCPDCHNKKSNKENIDSASDVDPLSSNYNSITKAIFSKAKYCKHSKMTFGRGRERMRFKFKYFLLSCVPST